MAYRALIIAASMLGLIVAGCASPEVDWRNRRAVLDMSPSDSAGIIGDLHVAGNVDGHTFTKDYLWIVVTVPTRRDLPINRLARIDLATNRFTDIKAVEGFGGAALASGFGSIWLAEGFGGEKVHRIDPNTAQTTATVELPRNPVAVAAGQGAVWVLAAKDARKWGRLLVSVHGWALYKIDPISNGIASVISLPHLEKPAQLVRYGRIDIFGGSIWVSVQDGSVLRIDSQRNSIEDIFPSPQAAASAEPSYALISNEQSLHLSKARGVLDSSVYGVAYGMGTFWAFMPWSKLSRATEIVRLHP